jgi:hypothetical protein
MTPDLKHPYGLRAWLRGRLPRWAIRLGLATKGKDCHFLGAAHHWYNLDNENSGCYYCQIIRQGQVWRTRARPLHEYDVVRVVRIKDSAHQHTPTSEYERPPRVGDAATIVSILGEDGLALVENVAPDGGSGWLDTFDHEELEVVECPHITEPEVECPAG